MSDLGNKQIMAKNIRYFMDLHNVNQSEVCHTLNIPMPTFSDWVNAKTYPRIDKIEMMANYFGISKADLVEERGKLPHPDLMPIKTKKWRVLGEIACGEPIYANEDFDSYIEAGADIPADFCVRAKGDSMINARILDGDIVFIRKQSMVENGDIAAVVIGDETTLKRFYKHGDTIHLLAENPKYEPLIYSNEELNQIYILGKAVAFQSDIK